MLARPGMQRSRQNYLAARGRIDGPRLDAPRGPVVNSPLTAKLSKDRGTSTLAATIWRCLKTMFLPGHSSRKQVTQAKTQAKRVTICHNPTHWFLERVCLCGLTINPDANLDGREDRLLCLTIKLEKRSSNPLVH